jgi:4-amino-4-deoxy-L-arabinose transferase-like glycosyltransferase
MTPRDWVVPLGIVVLSGAALRLAVAWAVWPVLPVGDEHYYLETAGSIARGDGHYSARFAAFAAWPPGNAWWLSHFVGAGPWQPQDVPFAAVLGQIGLQTLLVVLVAWLGRMLFDARTGLLAGAVVAVYPALVAFSHYFWAANLFSVLLTASLLGVVWTWRRESAGLAALSGVAFGLAALVREVALPIAGGCALWWLWRAPAGRRRGALLRGALMLSAALLVVLPWTARNYQKLGQLVPVSSAGWLALGQGNQLRAENWLEPDYAGRMTFARGYWARPEAERAAWAREQVLALIREEQPAWAFKKLVLNTALLFRPDSFIFWKLGYRAYGEVAPWLSRLVMLATMAAYLAVMTLGILAAVAARGRGSLLLAAALPLVALHVIAFASARYRLALMPLWSVFAAHGIRSAASGTLWEGLRGARGLVAALLLLALFAVCVPHFRADGLLMWQTGSYFE